MAGFADQSDDIAIIGGGIVGLALALGLHQRGLSATVYEAAPVLKELGVGITLLPHAMRELTALGLKDQIVGNGLEPKTSAFYNRFGQFIYSEARGLAAGYTDPEVCISRGRLHHLLYQRALKALGPERVRTNHQLVDLRQDETGVELRFNRLSDGGLHAPVRAGVVIGCDGVNSTVRKALYPDDKVVFTGINTWRGATRRKPILDGATYLRVGSIRTGKIVIYPIEQPREDGTQLINWTTEIQSDAAVMNDWNKGGSTSDFLSIYEAWHFDWLDVPELIKGAEMLLEYPMVDKDPLERWTFDRITLAGDAAHPMYPRGSNGSAQGLIDARTLSEALAERRGAGLDLAQALPAFEEARRPPTSRIVQTNRTSPPDIINIRVEELTGDKPFDDLDQIITQAELKRLSDNYKTAAGFAAQAALAG